MGGRSGWSGRDLNQSPQGIKGEGSAGLAQHQVELVDRLAPVGVVPQGIAQKAGLGGAPELRFRQQGLVVEMMLVDEAIEAQLVVGYAELGEQGGQIVVQGVHLVSPLANP